jgi:diaminopimelate epimerase
VGADGVIVALQQGNGDGIDICARFLEPDGSEAELCGNGTACFTFWAVEKGLVAKAEARILTPAGTAQGRVLNEREHKVRVCVPDPRDLRMDLQIEVKGSAWRVDAIDTGVPHAVAYVTGLERLDVQHWGPGIRHHELFAPRGVNANFVSVHGRGRIAIRTFEFGVEAETLACGTGSAAAAILTCVRHGWGPPYSTGEEPVHVEVRGGSLDVFFRCEPGTDGPRITDVCLETTVLPVYEGALRPDFTETVLA